MEIHSMESTFHGSLILDKTKKIKVRKYYISGFLALFICAAMITSGGCQTGKQSGSFKEKYRDHYMLTEKETTTDLLRCLGWLNFSSEVC